MTYLCDTNVLGELARPRANPGLLQWAQGVKIVSLSVVTLEEVVFGLSWHPNARVLSWFETFIERHCQVMPLTPEIARRSGQLRGQLRSRGEVRSQADMLIAATAAVHGLTLVTRDARDFQRCGIAVLDPFS